ncbi:MAG: hypothetical protein MUF61_02575 [archaeon]|jgi:hypothetical protein|nr:hypothetical protein [archaeon]
MGLRRIILGAVAAGLLSAAGCNGNYEDYRSPVVWERSSEGKQNERGFASGRNKIAYSALPRCELPGPNERLFDSYKREEWRVAKSELKPLLMKIYGENKEECIKSAKSSNIRLKIAGLEALAKWEKDDPEVQKLAIEEIYNCAGLYEYISGGRRDMSILLRNRQYANDLSNDGEQNNEKDFVGFRYFSEVVNKLAKYGPLAIPASLDRVHSEHTCGKVALEILKREREGLDSYSKELIDVIGCLTYHDGNYWAIYHPGEVLGEMLEEMIHRNPRVRLEAETKIKNYHMNFYIRRILWAAGDPHWILHHELDANYTTEEKFVAYELERDSQVHKYWWDRNEWDPIDYSEITASICGSFPSLNRHFGGDPNDPTVRDKHREQVKQEAIRKYRETRKQNAGRGE